MTYTNWDTQEPDNAMNAEACIQFFSYPYLKWNDIACGDVNLDPGYTINPAHMCPLCEIDLS